jgi:enoyl-[acyl-carrier protein] reductase II
MKTQLTELLGIKYPIIQGGMAYISDAVLVAAVSNAGGAGIIGTGFDSVESVRAEIRKTKTLTDKPFGVNCIMFRPDKEDMVNMVCEEKPAFVTMGGGNATAYIPKFHEAGIKVLPLVPHLKGARRVIEAGADGLILEGMEGGGHISYVSTISLLSNIAPFVDVPIIAAGGIATGKAVAATMIMGACGVQVGSLFLLAEECKVPPQYKQAIIDADDKQSVVTGYSRGDGTRCIKNKFTEEFVKLDISGASQDEINKYATGSNKRGCQEGDVEMGAVIAGQSLNQYTEVKPAKDIIEKLMKETVEAMEGADKILEQLKA